ncbi:MAG TPA: hydroxyisourate hydrolase [Thermoanaerobaculia bacterium]
MAGITTHILDTALGRPAAGIAITLEIFRDHWQQVASAVTNDDGRARMLDVAERAHYRITFDVAAYNPEGFFPRVTIEFRVLEPAQHHHVPLLLSPFGYSTYRGS